MSFQPATIINSAVLLRFLQGNKCGGCTALYDAVALAVQKTLAMSLLAKMLVQDKEKYIVVVLTDGENNRGEMNLAKTQEMMRKLAELGRTLFYNLYRNEFEPRRKECVKISCRSRRRAFRVPRHRHYGDRVGF